jgi:hypothetical protein
MTLLRLRTLFGQPSWIFESSHVSACLTRLSGHLAPVTFTVAGGPSVRSRQTTGRRSKVERRVQPYAIARWAMAREKPPQGTPALLRALRGDFFCCPFGANEVPFRGERHPPDCETANDRWRLEGLYRHRALDRSANATNRLTLHVSLSTSVRKGRVDKYLTLVDRHPAVYSRHLLTGMNGPVSLSHHALLKFPSQPDSGVLTGSRFVYARVLPTLFETPAQGGYQSLLPGATFRSLERMPTVCSAADDWTDLTRFPARSGFDDLVLLTADSRLRFAWTAVTFAREGYVWFALRDPRVLRHTILWMSNGGRHYASWSRRHVGVMGVEDGTAYFHYGPAESAGRNPLNRRGSPTTLRLNSRSPTSIYYIMGVAPATRGFDRVARIERSSEGIDLISRSGSSVHVALDISFLETGEITR